MQTKSNPAKIALTEGAQAAKDQIDLADDIVKRSAEKVRWHRQAAEISLRAESQLLTPEQVEEARDFYSRHATRGEGAETAKIASLAYPGFPFACCASFAANNSHVKLYEKPESSWSVGNNPVAICVYLNGVEAKVSDGEILGPIDNFHPLYIKEYM